MAQGNLMDTVGRSRKPFDLFGSIFKYLLVTILLGGALFACLLPIPLTMSKPYYHATGRILIERVREPFISRTEQAPITNFFYDYAQTEVQRLLHDAIVTKALESLPPDIQKRYAPYGITPQAIAGLRRSLRVGLIPNTHLIMVQLETGSPEGIAEVVNTLMRKYLEHAEQVEENKDSRRLAYLLEERNTLKQQAEMLTAQLASLASQAKTSSFVETYNVDSLRLIELQKAWVQVRKTRLELENKLREAAIKAGKIRKLPTQSLADELVAGDESLWSISYWTYKTLQEMRASVDGINVRNPDRQYVEQRMKAMKAYEANLKKSVEERAQRIVNDKREYELSSELLTVEAEYLAAQKTELGIIKELRNSREKAAENSRRIIRGQDISATLNHVRTGLHAMEARIQEIRAESKSPLRVSIEELARPPAGPAGNNIKKLIFLCFAGAFGGVGFAFLLLELADNRIRSTKDIIAATGHPPSWPISEWQGEAAFHEIIHKAPEQQASRALRSLAVRLNNERIRNDARLAVFASVDGLSGTTSIVANVARSLTGMGAQVLVVEADSHGQRMSRLLGLAENTQGLGDCLLTDEAGESCIVSPSKEMFDFLPMGELWGDEKNNRLGVVFASLRQKYDFIIIDAAPVLQSDLTEYMLLQSDVGVIVVQGDRTTYAALRQALEVFLRLQVPVITTVLNWGAIRTRNRAEKLLTRLPDALLRWVMPSLLRGKYLEDIQEGSAGVEVSSGRD